MTKGDGLKIRIYSNTKIIIMLFTINVGKNRGKMVYSAPEIQGS